MSTTKKPTRPERTSAPAKTFKKATAARKAPAKALGPRTAKATGPRPAKSVGPRTAKAVGPRTAKPVAAKPADRPTRSPKSGPELALPKGPNKRVKPNVEADVAERLHRVVSKALDDLKAKDVREIDVRGKTSITDVIVIASGTSTRHVKSIADEVVRAAKHAGLPPLGVEGQREAEWVLVDLGDIIVHVMLPRTREFYGLERLWTVGDDAESDAPLAG